MRRIAIDPATYGFVIVDNGEPERAEIEVLEEIDPEAEYVEAVIVDEVPGGVPD